MNLVAIRGRSFGSDLEANDEETRAEVEPWAGYGHDPESRRIRTRGRRRSPASSHTGGGWPQKKSPKEVWTAVEETANGRAMRKTVLYVCRRDGQRSIERVGLLRDSAKLRPG